MTLSGQNHRHNIDDEIFSIRRWQYIVSPPKSLKFRQERERRIYNIQSIYDKQYMTETGWHWYNVHDMFKSTFCRDKNKYSIIDITGNSLVIAVL